MLQARTTKPRRLLLATQDKPAALPSVAEVIDGRYLVHDVIGEGGMAVVLSATHLQLDALVAIKFLRPELRDHPESVERFLQEGRASAGIRSEHVARIHDVGEGQYGPYLVMEHLRGRDLEAVVRDDGPLSVNRAVDYMLQACEAIAEAHSLGVIHRDLKPSNLFLEKRTDGSEFVKVLDFGISKVTRGSSRPAARMTNPALLMGSPAYMSPEQANSARDVDARTDVWALGATLYELLTGRPPFGDGPSQTLWLRTLTERPEPISRVRPDVPRALDEAIARCLAPKLHDRYSSVAELARAIAQCGTSDGRTSAGRIARISGISGISDGWEIASWSRRTVRLRARDLLEAPQGRAIGARWSGFVMAAALVASAAGLVVWRCDTTLVRARAAASGASFAAQPTTFIAPTAPHAPEVRAAGAPARELLPRGDQTDRDAGPGNSAADASSEAGPRV
jgi:serine/threonine-protein kinase